jgi:predicted TIM-barrel fold metal-dependent hydrolase
VSGPDLERLGALPLRDHRPLAMVRRTLTSLTPAPPAPIVDAHQHLGRWLTGGWAAPDVGSLLATMDACGVAGVVNLDGRFGEELESNLDRYDRAHPGRFATFAHWDATLFVAGAWAALGEHVADSLARGARGLKVWKDLGLHLRDDRGVLVQPDDPRLDPVWDACAAAGAPVTIHVADPIAFFEPLDAANERLEELLANPDWWFGDRERFPSFDRIRDALEGLVARRRDVTFIGAHVLCSAEDLAWVGRVLDAYPNVHADLGARIAELGRVPRAARSLIERHADRFLFGTDAFPPDPAVYAVHRRFLETGDEAFPYDADPDEVPSQGRWTISGIELSLQALDRVYGANARRLIAGLGP